MYFSDRITLRRVKTEIVNGFSTELKPEAEKEVWADKQSVRRTEFYAADKVGRKVDAVFIVNAVDYDGETEIEWNGKIYDVVREYQPPNNIDKIELTCARR